MNDIIQKAVQWAVSIANDDRYYYSWGGHGPYGYDCSGFVIKAYQQAGLDVEGAGANTTHDIYDAFLKCGFQDVTGSINLSTGAGLLKGDVLLNTQKHTALVQFDGGATVEARGSAYGIVSNFKYRNYPWDYVLRYTLGGGGSYYKANWVKKELPNNPAALKTKTYENFGAITAKDTKNYEISHNTLTKTHSSGLRVYNDNFLVIALGSYYGGCGTYVKIEFDNGKTIYGIVGDLKRDSETNDEPPTHSYHSSKKGSFADNLLEVQVDGSVIHSQKEFLKAMDAYCGCAYASITGIWVSDSEPAKTYTGGSSSGTDEKQYNFANTNEKTPLNAMLLNQSQLLVDKAVCMVINGNDVTDSIGDLSWRSTIDELSVLMSFSVAKSDARYTYLYTPAIGDCVRYFTDGVEVFRGIILDPDYGGRTQNSYTAVDIGWYSKTKDTYQFTSIPAKDALTKIYGDLSVPIVHMSDGLDYTISEVYVEKSISDMTKDILAKSTNCKYYFDFTPEGIRFFKQGELAAEPEFHTSVNTAWRSSLKYRGEESRTMSFADMANAVKVISETDVLLKVKDDAMIEKFGFIQEVVKIDPEKEDAATVATAKLRELNRLSETYSFEIIEKPGGYTRAGMSVTLGGEGKTEIAQRYLITSADHSMTGGVHRVKLDLERLYE